MKLLCSLLLFACCIAADAQAADPFAHPTTGDALLSSTLTRPAATLRKAQVLRGSFTHSRYLSEIPKPLVGNGDFVFVRDLGVYWHTAKPFESVIVLTPKGIEQRDAGARTVHLSADEQPAVRVIANIFLALFTLDVASLDRNFQLFAVEEGERWTIGLRPRSSAVGHVFREATVSGVADVEQVVLFDVHGDRTVIDLSDIRHSDATAAADVRALFSPPSP